MKKKLISMVLSVFMVVSLFCGTYFAAKNILGFEPATSQVAVQDKDENVSAKATPSGNWLDKDSSGNCMYIDSWEGSITTSGIMYHIYNAGQLAALCYYVNINYYVEDKNCEQHYFKDADVYLENDLDMSAHYWTPIGTSDNPFEGDFNGQGYKISGVYISYDNSDANDKPFGLFGAVSGDACIENVSVIGEYVFSSAVYSNIAVGGVVGCARVAGDVQCHIDNCTFDGKIKFNGTTGGKNWCYIGGIVGVVCKANFSESTQDYYVGVGVYIERCINYSTFEADNLTNFVVGGIVAKINCYPTWVSGCTNLGTVDGDAAIVPLCEWKRQPTFAGGIVAAAYGAYIDCCVNYSPVFAQKCAGGIIGNGFDKTYVRWCVNYGSVDYSSYNGYNERIGGIAGQLGADTSNYYNWIATSKHRSVVCRSCVNYGKPYSKTSNYAGQMVGLYFGTEKISGYAANTFYYITSIYSDQKDTDVIVFDAQKYNSDNSFEVEYLTQNDKGTSASISIDDSHLTWSTAANKYLEIIQNRSVRVKENTRIYVLNNIKTSETILPAAALNSFTLNLKWESSDGSQHDFNSEDVAKVTLKNADKAHSEKSVKVHHLKGACYSNSVALLSVWYDPTNFTFKEFSENPAIGRIKNYKDINSNPQFDFNDNFSYLYYRETSPTITAVFTAKTQNVTFKTYLESTETAGLGVIMTGTTFGSGGTIVGSSSSSGTGAYSYLATISANITPTLGYYLYSVKDEKDDAKTLVREYGTSYGGRTRLTIENYDPSLFTTLKFVFKRIEYAYRLLCSWDSNSELSRVDKRWCIGNALTGADNTAYSKDSIPAQLQYGWTYYISAVVFGNGDDGPTDTHNLTYNANNQGCIYTSGTSRRIGFDGVLSSFNVDENAFCSACGNIDFVLGRTKIDYEVSTERYITGSTIIEDDRAGKVTLGGGNTSATKKVKVLDSMQVEMQTYVGYNLDKVEIRNISNSVQNSYDVADTDIPKQLEPNSKNEINAGLEYYLAGMAIKGKLTNEANFGKNIKIRVYFSRKKVQFYINNLTISGDNVTRNVELECYEAPYFNVIEVTARNPKANERYCGIYSGSNLLTTEKTYTFVVDANVQEIETLSIEAKFVETVAPAVNALERHNYAVYGIAPTYSGSRISGRTYKISKPEHIIWLSNQVVSGEFREKDKFILQNDINMKNVLTFYALGDHFNGYFNYKFDFNGYSIINAETRSYDTGKIIYGIFDYYDTSKVSNISMYQDISSVNDLFWLQRKVNNFDRFQGVTFKVSADIDMSGIGFRAIGTFLGNLDGCGHKIINLTAIDWDGNLTDGLFVEPIPNKIKNLSYKYNDSYIINNNVVTISSAQDLIWLREIVNAGFDFSGYIVKQTQDIDMTGKSFNPIGSTAHPFCGVYDGQNHIISNLNYSGWETISYVGFFGKTQNAVVKNLTIKDSIFTGYNDVGVFAAVADSTTFENVNAYNCTLSALHLQFYDIYGNEISKCGNDDTISVNYIRSTTIETQGKTATSRLAQSFRQMTLFGGFVGNGTKCNFVLASYINGTHTNELGREIYAFVGSGSNNTFDRCCALTQFSRSSQEISVPSGSVVYAYNGGTFTDVFAAQKNGSSISVLGKKRDHSSNWITINGLEVLKDFYWYF